MIRGLMVAVLVAGAGLMAAGLGTQARAADSAPVVIEVPAQPMLYVSSRAKVGDAQGASQAVGAAYAKILAVLGPLGVEVDGAPIAINRAFDPQGDWVFDAALRVKPAPAADSPDPDVKAGMTPSGRVVKVVHTGAYTGMKSAYDVIDAYMKANGLKPGAVSWEEYVSDPGNTPEDKLITNIYYQVAP